MAIKQIRRLVIRRVEHNQEYSFEVPENSVLRAVGGSIDKSDYRLNIWMEASPQDKLVTRRFITVGENTNFDVLKNYEYLGHAFCGPYTYHVYEVVHAEDADA